MEAEGKGEGDDGGQRVRVEGRRVGVEGRQGEDAGSPRSPSSRRAARSRSNCARPGGVGEGACALHSTELCISVSCGGTV